MSMINLSIKHGRTREEARAHLKQTVADVHAKFGTFVQRVEWSTDQEQVKILGKGFNIDMRVDAESVHVAGDIEFLGGLLGNPVVAGLKSLIQNNFQKRLK